jgi:pentatricopeptide repeat protein
MVSFPYSDRTRQIRSVLGSGTKLLLIQNFIAGGQWQQAMAIFHKMEAQGLRRDAITYSSTISALAKGKQWSLALQVGHHRLSVITTTCLWLLMCSTYCALPDMALQSVMSA